MSTEVPVKSAFEKKADHLVRLRDVFLSSKAISILTNPSSAMNQRIPTFTLLLALATRLETEAKELAESLPATCMESSLLVRLGGQACSPSERLALVRAALKDRNEQLLAIESRMAEWHVKRDAAQLEHDLALAAGEKPKVPEETNYSHLEAQRSHFATAIANLSLCATRAAKELLVEQLRKEAVEIRSNVERRMDDQDTITTQFVFMIIDMTVQSGTPHQLDALSKSLQTDPNFSQYLRDGRIPELTHMEVDELLKRRCDQPQDIKLKFILEQP